MKFDKKILIGVIAGGVVIIGDLIFLRGDKLFYFLFVFGLIIGVLPFIMSVIFEGGRKREIDMRFLEFVRDLVENVKAGTPISKGIINLRNRDYGALNQYVEKLVNQISLGIPLTKAFLIFAKDTGSRVIIRAVSLISESERAGGEIASILESISKSVDQIEELKKEQRSSVYSLVIQGYIIFIVFIIIMLVLQFKILPLIAETQESSAPSFGVKSISGEEFSTPMFILLLVQAFFAGLVIGKISEGGFMYGVKHSFILLALTLLISTGANAFLG